MEKSCRMKLYGAGKKVGFEPPQKTGEGTRYAGLYTEAKRKLVNAGILTKNRSLKN
ncbi:MAG: hypothetical protein IPG38_12005 [Chitinophagaceae bacterium]|nr:hypothetical protein [Chitinophagaceae bacterium]